MSKATCTSTRIVTGILEDNKRKTEPPPPVPGLSPFFLYGNIILGGASVLVLRRGGS